MIGSICKVPMGIKDQTCVCFLPIKGNPSQQQRCTHYFTVCIQYFPVWLFLFKVKLILVCSHHKLHMVNFKLCLSCDTSALIVSHFCYPCLSLWTSKGITVQNVFHWVKIGLQGVSDWVKYVQGSVKKWLFQ